MQKLFSLLAGLAPWLIVAGLAYAAAFIKPETDLRPLPQPLLEARDVFFDVVATADNTLIFVGNNGTLLTRGNDDQWYRGQFAEQLNLQAIAALADGTLAAVGNQGALYVYQGEPSAAALANAQNWQYQALPVSEFAGKLLAITAAPDGFWVVGEMGTIFHLQQDANHRLTATAKELDQDINLSDVAVASDGTVWIAGEFGTLLHSRDHGNTWQSQELTDVTLQSLAINADHMLVVGNSGFMAASYDDGDNWEPLKPTTTAHLYSATLSDDGWLVAGANGTLLWRDETADWQALEAADTSFNFISNSVALHSTSQFVFTGSHLTSLDLSATPLQYKAVTPTAKEGAL